MMQVKEVLKKTVKETSTPATVGSHGLKPSRPKSTNPKPFRLRTDVCGLVPLIYHQAYYYFISSLQIANLISLGWRFRKEVYLGKQTWGKSFIVL